jgi:S-adenosylmethionine-diacylgycerolhomoserine-N-methlytransferase
MGFVSDLRILYHLVFSRTKGDSHGERLEEFYRQQAGAYDDFRKRLLHGREQLMQALDVPAEGTLLDMGGGTGANIEFLGDKLTQFKHVTILDLTPSLLKVADERIRKNGWKNVSTVLADATTYEHGDGPLDVVTFSYSLTMIPAWFQAVDRAWHLLKPGGVLGVVDFYISRKWPAPGMKKHSAFHRFFWPTWFGYDNVFLNPDHIPYLQSRFQTIRLEEKMGSVPYMPLRAPYYIFLGRKV